MAKTPQTFERAILIPQFLSLLSLFPSLARAVDFKVLQFKQLEHFEALFWLSSSDGGPAISRKLFSTLSEAN